MQAILKPGNHSEVAPSSAQRPKEVGIFILAGMDLPAVGQHDVRTDQIVDGQAVFARQVAVAAAQRQPADAGRRYNAADRRQAVFMGGLVNVAPRAATFDICGFGIGIDPDFIHPGEVDDQSVIHQRQPGAVMPAAPDGDFYIVFSGIIYRLCHVIGILAFDDRPRMLVDHSVKNGPCLVVVFIPGQNQTSRGLIL